MLPSVLVQMLGAQSQWQGSPAAAKSSMRGHHGKHSVQLSQQNDGILSSRFVAFMMSEAPPGLDTT